jgi:hypothetical protein
MKTVLLLTLVLLCSPTCEAQTPLKDKTVTYFYVVNLDDDLSRILSLPQVVEKDTNAMNQKPNNELLASIADTFYTITLEKFRHELGLELLPLNALQGQVKYSTKYPNCPDVTNVKKVLKSASGYKYYADYYVNVFSDVSIYSPVIPSPTGIKPLYAISLTIYDQTGKLLKKINLSYKSNKALAEPRVDSNKTTERMKSKLCNLYSEALNQVAVEYKKTVAQL